MLIQITCKGNSGTYGMIRHPWVNNELYTCIHNSDIFIIKLEMQQKLLMGLVWLGNLTSILLPSHSLNHTTIERNKMFRVIAGMRNVYGCDNYIILHNTRWCTHGSFWQCWHLQIKLGQDMRGQKPNLIKNISKIHLQSTKL